jgi:hypothetical protein
MNMPTTMQDRVPTPSQRDLRDHLEHHDVRVERLAYRGGEGNRDRQQHPDHRCDAKAGDDLDRGRNCLLDQNSGVANQHVPHGRWRRQ